MALSLNTSHPLYSVLTGLICVDDDGVVKDLTGNQTCTPDASVTTGTGTYGRHFTTTIVSGNALGVALSPGFLPKPAAGTEKGTTFVVVNNAASRVSRGAVFPCATTNCTGPASYTGDVAGIAAGNAYPGCLGTTDIIGTGAHSFGCALTSTTSATFVDGTVEATAGSIGNASDSYRASYIGGTPSGGYGGIAADYVWVAQFSRSLTSTEIADLHASLGASNAFGLVASSGSVNLSGTGAAEASGTGGLAVDVSLEASGSAVAGGTATIDGGTVDVSLAGSGAAEASGSATISSSGGTVGIAIPLLRELSTGVDRSTEAGATVFVNAAASNSLIATFTGVSFGATGATVTHASFVHATDYRVTVVLFDGTEGTNILTAAYT